MDVTPGTMVFISHDILVGQQYAFRGGEQVLVESISPNPQSPQFRYVVLSKNLQKRFQLSDADLSSVQQPAQPHPVSLQQAPQHIQPTKQCPYCSETILVSAIKCKHCGSDLVKGQYGKPSPTGGPIALSIVALIIPICTAVLGWFLLRNTLKNLDLKLIIVCGGTVLITSILIAIEAHQFGFGSENDRNAKGRKKSGPGAWGLFSILFWIVGYPAYMYERKNYGGRNLVAAGIIVALGFAGVMGYVGYKTQQRVDSANQVIEWTQSNVDSINLLEEDRKAINNDVLSEDVTSVVTDSQKLTSDLETAKNLPPYPSTQVASDLNDALSAYSTAVQDINTGIADDNYSAIGTGIGELNNAVEQMNTAIDAMNNKHKEISDQLGL